MYSNKYKKLTYIFYLVIFLFGSLKTSEAQSLRAVENKGDKYYQKGNVVNAKDQYRILYDSGYNISSTASKLATCYLDLYEPQKAQDVLESLPTLNDENTYLLGMASLLMERFKYADSLFSTMNDTKGYELSEAKAMLKNAESYYENSKGYFVQNFGEKINTEDREYSAVMYNNYNQLIFTSRRQQSGSVHSDGLAYEMIYATEADSTRNGEWTNAKLLEMDGNRENTHDATVQVYHSGTRMISYRDGNLYSYTLKNGVWKKDGDLILKEINGNNTHCYLTPDEQTIFFASDFESNGLQLDLYVTTRDKEGNWSEPSPITELNTDLDEDSPFLAGDGTFYFSSRGHNSMGGYDIFKSRYDSLTNTWTAPENLGHPINSVAEDTYFTMEGKLGYLSSTRQGGFGSLDIYRVFLFNKVKVGGVLLDSAKNPIPFAEIAIKYDSVQLQAHSDSLGAYELFVPIYKEMKVTFVKDFRKLHEGQYIANVFFKDENENTFNFYFENVDETTNASNIPGSGAVQHINIKVRNDYSENLILDKVPEKEEIAWADRMNASDSLNRANSMHKASEGMRLVKQVVDMNSANMALNDVVVIQRIKEIDDDADSLKMDDGQYTVQILAMTMGLAPDPTFFNRLQPTAVVLNAKGKDGINRFYLGSYDTKKMAMKAMRKLRKIGYFDAFVRKIRRYGEL